MFWQYFTLDRHHRIYYFVCRADRSMYHSLGYATIMYLQAAMTFEPVIKLI